MRKKDKKSNKDEKSKSMPVYLIITAILFLIAAIYLIYVGASVWYKYYLHPPSAESSELVNKLIAWIGLFPALIIGSFMIISDIFLLKRKNWARWVIGIFSLIVGLFNLLGVFANWLRLPYAVIWLTMGVYLLANKRVKDLFIS
ncbi:hypothetical protein J4221_03280 [Candidatus Pacearchaeota archaeon]|nr:hypothetical protein [Candidatus Pacearchaeota archaeon]